MYNPERFMTVELVEQVLRERGLPVPYTLEDCDPDGVALDFAGGTLMFDEGFEGHVRIMLLTEESVLPRTVTLGEVLVALRAAGPVAADPALIGDPTPGATLDKVRNGIHDQLTLLLTYLPQYLHGDLGWIDIVRPYMR